MPEWDKLGCQQKKPTAYIIFKATIRSVLEYGSTAFNSASPTVKAKLNKIQSQALRIACGAMRSTSIASLQVEGGEMPLQIRRNETALKYSIKIKNDPKHPAKKIIKLTGVKFKCKQYTFQKETKDFLKTTPDYLPIQPNAMNTRRGNLNYLKFATKFTIC